MSITNYKVKGYKHPTTMVFVLNPRKESHVQTVLDIPEIPKVEPMKKQRKGRVKKNV